MTKRVRTMLIAKKLALQPAPTQQQLDRELEELKLRILPMLNAQLEGKNYFCGNGQITGYDLQVFCEISSMKVFAEDLIESVLQE